LHVTKLLAFTSTLFRKSVDAQSDSLGHPGAIALRENTGL